jgi:MFS family permease
VVRVHPAVPDKPNIPACYEDSGSGLQGGGSWRILVFAAGHVADRYDRRRVAQLSQLTAALAAAFLAWGSFAGWITVPEIFAAVAVFGAAIAFESPAVAAILPGVVPEGMLQRAAALSTGAFQMAAIGGPALGGLFYALGPPCPMR